MRSLISEFSYGFALTHELVDTLGPLTAAPVFPSLIDEASKGWDVNLSAPGIPLFLQFKRSEKLTTGRAREIKAGAPIGLPYYRLAITGSRDSAQHRLLWDLDQPPNRVFYAAPLFHLKGEFDTAYLAGTVRQRSFFVRPRDIGLFADDLPHAVSFDGRTCVVMSKPREIRAYGAADVAAALAAELDADPRPLRAVLPDAVAAARAARGRGRVREAAEEQAEAVDAPPVPVERQQAVDGVTGLEEFVVRQMLTLPPPARRPADDAAPADVPAADRAARGELRELADIGLREFNAQLYVVQRAD